MKSLNRVLNDNVENILISNLIVISQIDFVYLSSIQLSYKRITHRFKKFNREFKITSNNIVILCKILSVNIIVKINFD